VWIRRSRWSGRRPRSSHPCTRSLHRNSKSIVFCLFIRRKKSPSLAATLGSAALSPSSPRPAILHYPVPHGTCCDSYRSRPGNCSGAGMRLIPQRRWLMLQPRYSRLYRGSVGWRAEGRRRRAWRLPRASRDTPPLVVVPSSTLGASSSPPAAPQSYSRSTGAVASAPAAFRGPRRSR